jgi:hypothetical protein
MVNEFETAVAALRAAVGRAFTNHIDKGLKIYRMYMHKKSYVRAVKHANHVRRSTGRKCYVLFFKDSYKAITKQHIKHLLSIKYFKPGTSLKDIEALAAYTTN